MMATSMLAARLYGPKDIRVQKVDVPEISDEEILVQVKSSFICGTDVRMYMNGHPAASPDKPLITVAYVVADCIMVEFRSLEE